MKRNLLLLALCQGLFLTNNISFIAINGLVGLSLAPVGWLATLPIMSYVIGSALLAGPVAHVHARLGRQKSFMIGALIAVVAAMICVLAVQTRNFALLILGTFISGFYQANGQLYRFVAAEISTESLREKAVSWVLAGGLLGAIAGPNIATATKNLMSADFAGSYLALALVGLVAIAVLSQINFPDHIDERSGSVTNISAVDLLRRPAFALATGIAALSYGVMNLLMAATPLAMNMCNYSFNKTALVLEWHVIAMFAPGFFTGHLIRRFGSISVMLAGAALYLICIGIAVSGDSVTHFFVALFCLGLGWNLLFTASTTLALKSYSKNERDKAQAIINASIFVVMAFTALGSGALVIGLGWTALSLGSIFPTVIIIGSITLFLIYRRKIEALNPKDSLH
jgi:MFS family permease